MKFLCALLLLASVYSCCLCGSSGAECPRIIKRHEWGARPPVATEPLGKQPVPYVVIHHGGTKDYCFNQQTCSAIVRSYQDYHIDGHGWNDIGYNFVVGEDGFVYEGRGWDKLGAHAPGYNNQSIGVCVIGDFTERMPNQMALDAVEALIFCGVHHGEIDANYYVLGHRQAKATACPGDKLYNYITTWQHWTPTPTPTPVLPVP